ncbi:MAG: MATE family efflux transporter [Bacteroidales bacterium]|nr:MATE family efflux transporter [Bacteroidales bacterium]
MNRRILNLALPNVISNITVPFVGIIDIALVGRMGSSAFIGGVGYGTMVFTLIYTGLAFLRMGTTGIAAQAYGASDYREASNSLIRALVFALISALFLIGFQSVIKEYLILNLEGSKEALNFAAQYFGVRIWAAPATLSVYVFMGWFIGMQNSKIPMIITFIISLSNIFLSSFFVLALDMKIEGVALGTVLAQYLGFISCIWFFVHRYRRYSLFFSLKTVMVLNKLKRFFSVSRDIFIRSILLTGSFFLFNIVSAGLGDDILALNSVMLQFLWFFAYFIDGFAYAGGTLSGRFVGENNRIALVEAIYKSVRFGFFIAIAFTIIYFIAGAGIFRLITDEQTVIDLSQNFKFWLWLIPLSSFLAFLYDGIYVGATATSTMRNIMIVSVLIIFIPLLFILKHYFGNHGMWLAIMFLLISRGFGLLIFLKTAVLKKTNPIKES